METDRCQNKSEFTRVQNTYLPSCAGTRRGRLMTVNRRFRRRKVEETLSRFGGFGRDLFLWCTKPLGEPVVDMGGVAVAREVPKPPSSRAFMFRTRVPLRLTRARSWSSLASAVVDEEVTCFLVWKSLCMFAWERWTTTEGPFLSTEIDALPWCCQSVVTQSY